jgi:hypothetical protein
VRTAAFAFAVGFLIVGVMGFIPGITTHYRDMAFASLDSHAKLVGLLPVSVLHNLTHLLFGVAGVAGARHVRTARAYFLASGAAYAIIWLFGLVTDAGSGPLRGADDRLHLALAVLMLGLGLVFSRERSPGTRPTADAG